MKPSMVKKKILYRTRTNLYRLFRDLVKWLILSPSGWFVFSSKGSMIGNKKKHLILLKIDGIGDFVLLARDLHRFRTRYPYASWEITLMGNAIWKDLAEEWNKQVGGVWFDHFEEIDRQKIRTDWKYRRDLATTIKQKVADELVCIVHARDVWVSILMKWIPSKIKIAPRGDTRNCTMLAKWWYDHFVHHLISTEGASIRENDLTNRFIQAIGMQHGDEKKFVHLPVTEKMITSAKGILQNEGVTDKNAYIVIFPGAAMPGKRWPFQYFIDITSHSLKDNDQTRIVICGGDEDYLIAAQIQNGIGKSAVNLAGKTTLIALAGILANSKLCISNDSAAVHIAAAFRVPTVCILGGGHWNRFWPYGDSELNRTLSHEMECFGCGWVCKYNVGKDEPMPCISNITPGNNFMEVVAR